MVQLDFAKIRSYPQISQIFADESMANRIPEKLASRAANLLLGRVAGPGGY